MKEATSSRPHLHRDAVIETATATAAAAAAAAAIIISFLDIRFIISTSFPGRNG